ncbi:WD40 repeat-like protein [Lentinula novae-zelandiae]|nr:WD40 repeat-like protein [Lentinula novae-zelandiae]
MSGAVNSRYGKRLRATYEEFENENSQPDRKRCRINLEPPTTISPSRKVRTLFKVVPNTRSPRVKHLKTRCSFEFGDRFVPCQENNIQISYNLGDEPRPCAPSASLDPVKGAETVLRSELTSSPNTPRRVFAYHSSEKSLSESNSRLDDPTDKIYQLSQLQLQTWKLIAQARPRIRKVARTPYKSLDAPDISDDFHTNLLDWSPPGTLGVGLGFEIYLWRADTDEPTPLCTIPSEKDEYSALAWMQTSPIIALATYRGHLEVYDASTRQLVRRYRNAHGKKRIGTISWTSHVFSSGSGDFSINHWDFREPSAKPFKKSRGHKSEVCGVKWSTNGGVHASILASGGNDSKICIWDLRGSTRDPGLVAASNPAASSISSGGKQVTSGIPPLRLSKVLRGILASGGGVRDRCIRIWNTTTGRMLNEVDTMSQVCNLIWSVTSHELVSTHGYANVTIPNQICVWKYPSMSRISCLNGHRARVQHVALNPNGDTIVTGSGDQSLHFWNIFPGKTSGVRGGDSVLNYGKLIR